MSGSCHAFVTGARHPRHVAHAVGSSRTGVLIIRVWSDPEDAGQLRMRVTSRRDVSVDDEEIQNSTSIDEVLEHARTWLRAFS